MDIYHYVLLEEGSRAAAYDDATGETLPAGAIPIGTPTIGVGCTGPDILPGLIWTQAQVDAAYAKRLLIAEQQAAADVGAAVWSSLNDVRQASLTSMSYNMGGAGLGEFHQMIHAIAIQDWDAASNACLQSRAARQLPARYLRHANMLRSGLWQPGYGG